MSGDTSVAEFVAKGAGPAGRPGLRQPGDFAARLKVLGLRSLSILGFFAIWWGVSWGNANVYKAFHPALLPSPAAVFAVGVELLKTGELQRHILASLSRVVQGFLLAAFLGILAGTLVGRSRTMENLIEPVIELLRPIPPLAFLPMMVLWFGIDEGSKIAFIAYAAFFPIFTTTVEGIKYVDPLLLRAASSLGARGDFLRSVTEAVVQLLMETDVEGLIGAGRRDPGR